MSKKNEKAVLELDKMIRVVARKMRVKGAHRMETEAAGSWHTAPNCSAPCTCSGIAE